MRLHPKLLIWLHKHVLQRPFMSYTTQRRVKAPTQVLIIYITLLGNPNGFARFKSEEPTQRDNLSPPDHPLLIIIYSGARTETQTCMINRLSVDYMAQRAFSRV